MPLAGNNHLDDLYARARLVEERRCSLEVERERLERAGEQDELYLLGIEINALSEESSRLGSSISDILERDLQR